MDVSRAVSEGYKVWIASGGVLLALLWAFLPRRAAVGILGALTLVAALNYARWGPRALAEKIDAYDLIHYYLNARYFDELGYYDLYPACILADHENFGPYFDEGTKYMAQDPDGHRLRPIAHAVERGRVVKETRFTPERWEAFSRDFLYLQRSNAGFTSSTWRDLIQDHGFNGTIPWLLVARPFSMVPVEYVKLLGWIDVVLLGGALVALARAYSGVTAVWTGFWLLVTYSTRWPTFTWAFFRYDYVAALLLGMSALRSGRPFLAGIAVGWAAALRMFPITWLYGPGAKGVFGLLRGKIHRPLLLVLAGFVAAFVALEGLGVAIYGVEPVKTHFENMEDHQLSENLSSRRMGLALALPYRGDLLPKNLPAATKVVIEDQKPLRYAITGVLLLVLGFALRNAKDDEAYAFGFLPFFLITTASYYYYVVRVTLVVLHASRLPQPRHMFGLAWLVGLEVFSNWAETAYPEHRVFLVGSLAWGLGIYAVVQAVWANWDLRKEDVTSE